MTVLTFPSISGKKPSSSNSADTNTANADKRPLVNEKDLESNTSASAYSNDKKSPLIVTMLMRSRAQRISSMTTICVFLTALLVFTTGIVGGYYLYRQFTQYKLRHYRGWCSIPYDREELLSSTSDEQPQFLNLNTLRKYITASSLPGPMSSTKYSSSPLTSNKFKSEVEKYMDEEFDIDLEFEEFERIEVPNFGLGGRGRFVHDFNINLTGIVDLDNNRCFILPLNRSLVYPPRNLVDMILKIQAGYYNIDTSIVRESYRVITPAITDYKTVGYFIARECGELPTYRLEKKIDGVFKRSIEKTESRPIFSEFAGRNIVELHIDASNAPGKHSGHN